MKFGCGTRRVIFGDEACEGRIDVLGVLPGVAVGNLAVAADDVGNVWQVAERQVLLLAHVVDADGDREVLEFGKLFGNRAGEVVGRPQRKIFSRLSISIVSGLHNRD